MNRVFEKEKISFDDYEIPGKVIDTIQSDILEQTKHQPSQSIRILNLFRRFLLQSRYKNKWRSKIIGLAAELTIEESPFSYVDGIKIHQVSAIKKEFLRSLLTIIQNQQFPPEPNDEMMLTEYLAYCTLSAIIYGRIYDEKLLKIFVHSIIYNARVYKQKMWVDFKAGSTDERLDNKSNTTAIKYRWLPDPLSSIMILRRNYSAY